MLICILALFIKQVEFVYNAKLYQTTEECSLPDLEQSNDNFGFRPIKEPEEATDELNFGQVRVQDCGLVNLAVVLTNPNAGYVEHLIQPIFVNCSLDFQVDFEGDLGETLIYSFVFRRDILKTEQCLARKTT